MSVSQDDIIEVVVEGDFDDQAQLLNVYQFQATQASTITDTQTLDDLIAFFAALYDAAKAIWTAAVAFRKITVRNLTLGTVVGTRDFSGAIQGTAAGDPLPPGVAALITFSTPVKNTQLRKFLPAPAESAGGTNGQFNSGTLATLATFGATLLPTVVGTNGSYNYVHARTVPGLVIRPNGATVPAEPSYQRRRKRGVGS
jgi:hypothetical protein